MSFQRPEFLLALVLALLPAAFYLSRYVRSTRTVFPAAHYLFSSDKTPLARLRSRQIIATLLRAAIICLAALAFAGPVLPDAVSPSAQRKATKVVLVVDTSASMATQTVSGETALATIINSARAVIDDTSDGTLVAIVPCPRPPEKLLWLPRREAQRTLAGLTNSWQTCEHGPLLESLLPTLPRETQFHLFTDLALADKEWTRLASLLARSSNVALHQAPVTSLTNRSVAGLWPTLGGIDMLVETNADTAPASEVTVRCPDYEATIPLPATTPAGVTIEIPVPADLSPGLCEVTLVDDALTIDNYGWFETGSPDPTTVLIVDGSPGHSVVASPGGFITASLRAGDAPVRIVHLAQTEFSYDSLRLADLLILVDPRPLPEYLEKGLVEFLARGGDVWLFAGDAMAEWKSDNLLVPGLQSRRCVALPEQPFRLTWTSPDDPAIAAVRDLPQAAVQLWNHVRHTALTFLGREVAVLARFDDGVPLVVRVPIARGELLLWSLVPAADNGNFALHPAFPLTMQSVFAGLAHPEAEIRLPPACPVGKPCHTLKMVGSKEEHQAEGGATSRRVNISSQEELICPEPGPYFVAGPEGRKLTFVCRTERREGLVATQREFPHLKQDNPPLRARQKRPSVPVAQLLLLTALALVFVELWMVSGRLKNRYEA